MQIDLSSLSEADLLKLKKKIESKNIYSEDTSDRQHSSDTLQVKTDSSEFTGSQKRMVISGKILLHKANHDFIRYGVIPGVDNNKEEVNK